MSRAQAVKREVRHEGLVVAPPHGQRLDVPRCWPVHQHVVDPEDRWPSGPAPQVRAGQCQERRDLLASDLAATEIASALARRVRERRLRPEHARRVHQTILSALHDGPYRRLELGREEHREAERPVAGH